MCVCHENFHGPQKCLFFYMQKKNAFIYFWFWDYNMFMVGFETQRSTFVGFCFVPLYWKCSRLLFGGGLYSVWLGILWDTLFPENIETLSLTYHPLWQDVIISSQGEFAYKICLFGYQRLAVRPARFEFVPREPLWLLYKCFVGQLKC